MRGLILLASLAAFALAGVGAASPVPSAAGTSSAAGWKAERVGWGYADDINEQGQIVGQDAGKALLWQNGEPSALEAPDVELSYDIGNGFVANAINDSGEIVGGSWWWEYAFLWRNGDVQTLRSLPRAKLISADDINNRGEIVGWSGIAAVVWEDGEPRRLLGRACDEANAVSDNGAIVGVVSTRCGEHGVPRYPRAVLWEAGTPRILVNAKSEAVAINNLGQIVGWRKPTWARLRRGFLWENGITRDLGSGFLPEAINDRGQIVGSCGKRACVWESGKLTKLDELGYHDAVAAAINERQQIVGYAISGGGELRELGVVLLWTFKR
jgi:probable HAF family extracellular repeat protein